MFAICPNKSFLLTPKRKKYCSTTCRAKGVGLIKSQKLHLTCLVCGKPLEVKPSHYKRGNGRYCSVACQHLAQRSISPAELHRLYWGEHLSAHQIAQRYGMSHAGIQHKMARYKISSRTRSESLIGHNGNKGRKQNLSEKQHRANSERTTKRWANPEYRARVVQAIMSGAHIRPTSPERRLDEILQKSFPAEWKYVGDGQFTIGGLYPDFINVNGRKLAIDMFGDYWHGKGAKRLAAFEPYRKEVLSEYGFRLLVIWERNLKDEAQVVEKVQKFMEVSL